MVTVRPAVVGDEHALAELNAFVQDLHVQHRPDHFKPTLPEDVSEWYRSLLQAQTARMWIAEEDGRPAGYVLVKFQNWADNPFTRARTWCEIDQIAVDPSYRRRGIARALIVQAITEAKAQGVESIETASWAFNDDTHVVFRRLGFEVKSMRFELKRERSLDRTD
jgi:diamine N-acetyltransferase